MKKPSPRVKDLEVEVTAAYDGIPVFPMQHDAMAPCGGAFRTTFLLATLVNIAVAEAALPRCVPIDGGVFEGDLLSQPGGCCTSKPEICRRVDLDR